MLFLSQIYNLLLKTVKHALFKQGFAMLRSDL